MRGLSRLAATLGVDWRPQALQQALRWSSTCGRSSGSGGAGSGSGPSSGGAGGGSGGTAPPGGPGGAAYEGLGFVGGPWKEILEAAQADRSKLRELVATLHRHCLLTQQCPPLASFNELLRLANANRDRASADKLIEVMTANRMQVDDETWRRLQEHQSFTYTTGVSGLRGSSHKDT